MVKSHLSETSPFLSRRYPSDRDRLSVRVFNWYKSNCTLAVNHSEFLSDLYDDYVSFSNDLGVIYPSKKMFSLLLIENLHDQIEKGYVAKLGKGKVTIKGLKITK